MAVPGQGAPDEVATRAELGDGQSAVLTAEHHLYLETLPLPGEGLLALCRRVAGTDSAADAVRAANDDAGQLVAGRSYRIPIELLIPELRRRVLGALFPHDRARADAWEHRVGRFPDLPSETLWRVAERFTGAGANYRQLRELNRLPDNDVDVGQTIRIPATLLLPAFRAEVEAAAASGAPAVLPAVLAQTVTAVGPTVVPSLTAPTPVAAAASEARASVPEPLVGNAVQDTGSDFRLQYGRDAQGEYAVYRLKPGEALYSSVVVRFTGRIYATDVNALAAEIARRNGVEDVTDMPIGFPVKIPYDLLQPEFLPPGHPRRVEYEAAQRASAKFSNPVRSTDLAGITVILDAGHGGRDIGTSKLGVWESTYVYDIMVRLKEHLETYTSARVYTTTRDGDTLRIVDRDVLPYTREHQVLTTPPYSLMEDSRVGVHLRWYLANSLYRDALKRGSKPEDVVFISLHADSLHPSLRGAMAYIPDAELRRGTFGKQGYVYTSRREVREKPRVSYSWRERTQSEGLSRQLAEAVIGSLRQRQLAVHKEQPVRQKIYRGRNPWVPAVLRFNAVPAEILLEVCNLSNDEDRRLLQSRAFRQSTALAIADGLRSYYSTGSGPAPVATAAR
ncbi:MAG: N-acetylmuramoyl-L-alanine amidase [Acidobacteria bacterium]|nr:N-acetylmuramoyl-L-alanine amidase [Acidobacteriota bacterium]